MVFHSENLDGLAPGPVLCPAEDRDNPAEKAVPRLLRALSQSTKAGRSRISLDHWVDVESQSDERDTRTIESLDIDEVITAPAITMGKLIPISRGVPGYNVAV